MMWDSQGENLAQGCLSHVACQELSWRQSSTNDANIKQHLLPALEVLLMVMMKPAHMSLADMDAFAEAIVQIHNFFTCFDWEKTWASNLVACNSYQCLSILCAHAICASIMALYLWCTVPSSTMLSRAVLRQCCTWLCSCDYLYCLAAVCSARDIMHVAILLSPYMFLSSESQIHMLP